MLIHSPQRRINEHPPITICNHTIEEVNQYTFLGLTLDSTMRWSAHINLLKKKLSSLCGIMRKMSAFVPTVWLKRLYLALVHSRLQYLFCNWGLASKSNLHELQVLQNRCLKVVYCKPMLYPSHLLYSNPEDSILPILALHEMQILVQIHKIATDTTLHHNMTLLRVQQHRETRQAGNFVLARPYTEFGKKRFSFKGCSLYNALSPSHKMVCSLKKFKACLSKSMKQRVAQYLCKSLITVVFPLFSPHASQSPLGTATYKTPPANHHLRTAIPRQHPPPTSNNLSPSTIRSVKKKKKAINN